ncbi:TRC40/GET3/ArsA family transport-energizing ATPase [Bacillus pseudomycoides]|uniref:TRC40/GET3/ArsA family transport-energizing ATPase n=1 Tax=Bacillus pseudomycoides TaxID=64104 RepID=UPI003000C81B
MTNLYNPNTIAFTPFLFFTGKGGVGKTSTACATAITLADMGKKVLLISTDPASNLQDVFEIELTNIPKEIPSVPNLQVANLDPETAAHEYKERVVGPYRGKLPDAVIATMEEQLSGACTVEMAAFDEFSTLLTNKELTSKFDHIIFDTAPTGHTLLLLDAAQTYHKEIARSTGEVPQSVKNLLPRLRNPEETSVVIVTLAEATPVHEASRLQEDLKRADITPKWWVINQSFYATHTSDFVLRGRAQSEIQWIQDVQKESQNNCVIIPWQSEDIVGYEKLKELVK